MNAGNEAERRLRAECREWLTLLQSGDASELDRQRFAAWLHADPRHERAYSRLQDLWQEIGDLRRLAPLEPVPPASAAATRHAAPPVARLRRGLPWAAAAAAAGLAIILVWQQLKTPAPQRVAATFIQEYRTGLGQIRRVVLQEGSAVTLAPLTNLRVELDDRERRVRLESGEAYFAVAKDAARPFRVDAAGAAVRVTGTQFDVRTYDDYVRVAVTEGRVIVNDRHDPLVGGQRIDVLADGSLTHFVKASNGDIAGWRNGRLQYENAPLADVVADLSRYRRVSVAPDCGKLRVTAGLRVAQIDMFINGLSHTLPVQVRRDGEAVVITRSR